MASPTFSQHFQTQVSPQHIQLDPIHYECTIFWPQDSSHLVSLASYKDAALKCLSI